MNYSSQFVWMCLKAAKTFEANAARDSGRKGASSRKSCELALTVGSESETRADIFSGKIRKFSQQFFLRHASCKVFQHVGHRHSRTANAGLAASLIRLNGNDSLIIHNQIIPQPRVSGEGSLSRLLD